MLRDAAPAAPTEQSTLGAAPKRDMLRHITPYVFIIPAMTYLCLVMFWPLAREIWMSLTDTRLMNPTGGEFVGLENYRALLAGSALAKSLWVTVVYTAGTVVFSVLFGVISALALNRPFRGRTVARSVMLFGYAVPSVAAILIWFWMYNEASGVFNSIARALGYENQAWLTSSDLALLSILVVTIWQVTPLVMLVVLAALQSVPEEVREAARVDGADSLNVFRTVTLPHIRPSVELVALLVTVWTIRRFEVIFLLTGGGPVRSTSTLVVSLRQVAFENHDLGTAAAYGVVGLVLAVTVALAFNLLKRATTKEFVR